MLWKCCTQYASKFGKLSSGHRTGKGQFHSNPPKKDKAKECSNQSTIALISHASKVKLKILQARLQQYVNRELLDVLWTRDQIANIHWIMEKAREFQKNIYFCFSDYAKAFDWVEHSKLWKFLTRWEYQTTWPASWEICAGQEATVRTGHGTTDCFQIRKGLHQGCILLPCLFNLHAEYII